MNKTTVDYGAFTSLSTDDFLEKLEDGYAVIDVRRQDEWNATGIIEGSEKITFFDETGQYNAQAFLDAFSKVVTQKGQPFILVCAHANRTKSIGEFLGLKMGYKHVFELDGGIIDGWIDLGYGTVR